MNFEFAFCDYEPLFPIDYIFQNSFALSNFGGFTKWRNKFHFMEISYDARTDEELFADKAEYLQRAINEKISFGVVFPFYTLTKDEEENVRAFYINWVPVKPKKRHCQMELTPLMVESHLKFLSQYDIRYLCVDLNQAGELLDKNQEDIFLKKFDFFMRKAKEYSLPVQIRNGGLRWPLIKQLLIKYDITLNLDLGRLPEEGLDFYKMFHEVGDKIEVIALSQSIPGRAKNLPLTHKGIFNFIALFNHLKENCEECQLVVKTKPELRDIDYLMENLRPEGYDRILSKS